MTRKTEDRLLGEISATLSSLKEGMSVHMLTDRDWHEKTTQSLDKLSSRIADLEEIKNKGWGVLWGLSLTSGLIGAAIANSFKTLFH